MQPKWSGKTFISFVDTPKARVFLPVRSVVSHMRRDLLSQVTFRRLVFFLGRGGSGDTQSFICDHIMTVPVPSSFETLSSYSVSRSSGKKRPRHMEGGGHQSDPSLVTWRNSSNSGIDGGGSGAIRFELAGPTLEFMCENIELCSRWCVR